MRLGVSAAVVSGRLLDGDVEISDGRVSAVGLTARAGQGIAVPGFVDVHVHGSEGLEFATAGPDEHARIATSVTRTGVTAYQPTLWSAPIDQMAGSMASHPGRVDGGARVLGYHLEGPFLSPDRPGAHLVDNLLPPAIEPAERLLEAGPVRQMTVAPELEGALDLIGFLTSRGVEVSLGHSNATAREAEEGLEAGARAFTHVFNAMGPFHHRSPGIVGCALSTAEGYVTAIFDGVHLSHQAARVVVRCVGSRLVAITDGTAATGRGSGQVELGGQAARVADGAPRLEDGTIAGSVLTMDAAFRNLVDLGLGLAEASAATSTAPAALAGLDGMGRLAPGAPADIAVLDADLQVAATYVEGARVYP